MFRKVILSGIPLFLILTVALVPTRTFAGEHPSEHPADHPAEHPETKSVGMTKEALAQAISGYVQKETKLKGGYFLVYDQAAKRPLVLTLDRVHEERLATVSGGIYFACADFKDPDNRVYDLDIFMKQGDSGLKVTEISIHKEDGAARYNWFEKDGVWIKKGL